MGSNSNDRVAEIYDAALKDGAGNQMNAAALRDKLGLVALPEGADAKAKRDQVFAAINDLSSGKDESKLQLWESLFKAHPERPGDLDTIPLPPNCQETFSPICLDRMRNLTGILFSLH